MDITWKELWDKIIIALRKFFRVYEKEIREFVDSMINLASQKLTEAELLHLTPYIRKKIANKILADILILGIDITTEKGKAEVAKLTHDAISWFTKESE